MFTNEIKIMLYVDDVEKKMQRFGEQLALRKKIVKKWMGRL